MSDDEKPKPSKVTKLLQDFAKKTAQSNIERKRAEVRKRMELRAKIAKKGFMTPARKKKLRLLLRRKAAEEFKKEIIRKAVERKYIIEQRCGNAIDLHNANEDIIKNVCNQYHSKIATLENDKYDLEYKVAIKDLLVEHGERVLRFLQSNKEILTHHEIADPTYILPMFRRPTLKKVTKYPNKFAEPQCRAAAFNFRNQLKHVKKNEFTLEDEKKKNNPDWLKNKVDAKVRAK